MLKEKYFVLTSIDGPHDNVLVLKPPLVFAQADADELLASFEKVVVEDLPMMQFMTIGHGKTPT